MYRVFNSHIGRACPSHYDPLESGGSNDNRMRQHILKYMQKHRSVQSVPSLLSWRARGRETARCERWWYDSIGAQQASTTVRTCFYPSYKAMPVRTYPTAVTLEPHPVGNNQCRAALSTPDRRHVPCPHIQRLVQSRDPPRFSVARLLARLGVASRP